MSGKLAIAKEIILFGKDLVTDKKVQKMILGTYSDGRVRSIPDALHGEVNSPKKKKKKKKKNKKALKYFKVM